MRSGRRATTPAPRPGAPLRIRTSLDEALGPGKLLARRAARALLERAPQRSGLGPVGTLGPDILFFHVRSEEHTSELQSLMRISYAVFCLKKKKSIEQQ